ncbi:MAG: hypothetical protein KDA37_18135 [Planctomycetales bacterium]|nr:hypothetical protein [Planctomycetales bacterium]
MFARKLTLFVTTAVVTCSLHGVSSAQYPNYPPAYPGGYGSGIVLPNAQGGFTYIAPGRLTNPWANVPIPGTEFYGPNGQYGYLGMDGRRHGQYTIPGTNNSIMVYHSRTTQQGGNAHRTAPSRAPSAFRPNSGPPQRRTMVRPMYRYPH